MEKKSEYIDHIKESWNLSLTTAKEQLGLTNHTATNVAIVIFEKCCSPYHYFLTNDTEPEGAK